LLINAEAYARGRRQIADKKNEQKKDRFAETILNIIHPLVFD
jgi:hypothetical protein